MKHYKSVAVLFLTILCFLLSPAAFAGDLLRAPSVKAKKSGMHVTWERQSGAAMYLLYRKTEKESKYHLIAQIKGKDGHSFRDKTDEKGTSYVYRVAAVFKKANADDLVRQSEDSKPVLSKRDSNRILFIGDSITWGYVTKRQRTSANIPAIVKKKLKVPVKNAGKVGALLSDGGKRKISVVNRLEDNSLHIEKYNIIVIEAGTNDFSHSVKIGKISDKSKKTFYGAWNKVFSSIRKYNPKAKVVIVTPIYRTQKCVKSSRKTGFSMVNSRGTKLKSYVDAEKAVAKKYHAKLYNSGTKKVINKSNAKKMLKDGLHPTKKGYKKLGNSIASYLKKLLD